MSSLDVSVCLYARRSPLKFPLLSCAHTYTRMGQQPSNLAGPDNNKQPPTSNTTSVSNSSIKVSRSLSQSNSRSEQQKRNISKKTDGKNDSSQTNVEPIKIPIADGNTLLAQWKELEREEFEKNGVLDEKRYQGALKKENYDKNRYYSVLAPDKTRVKLARVPEIPGSDYINANYIDGIHKNGKQAYIASQAPLPVTFNDFWRMIWEQKISILVMLTRLEEDKMVKAHRYWPTKGEKIYGDIKVTLISNKSKFNDDYRVRMFALQKDNEVRTVFQFHYLAWPDHGVPNDPHSLIEMMKEIDAITKLPPVTSPRDTQSSSPTPIAISKKPLVIHCSAGIGRTGTFIVIHTVLSKLQEENSLSHLRELNLQAIVSRMREQRPGLITQKEQYFFCYNAILYAVQTHAGVMITDDGFLVSGCSEVPRLISIPTTTNTNSESGCSSVTAPLSSTSPPSSPLTNTKSSSATVAVQGTPKVNKVEESQRSSSSGPVKSQPNKVDSSHPQLSEKLSQIKINNKEVASSDSSSNNSSGSSDSADSDDDDSSTSNDHTQWTGTDDVD